MLLRQWFVPNRKCDVEDTEVHALDAQPSDIRRQVYILLIGDEVGILIVVHL